MHFDPWVVYKFCQLICLFSLDVVNVMQDLNQFVRKVSTSGL